MTGLFKFIGDVLKPIITMLVTVLLAAFVVAVFSPRADNWLENTVPAWRHADPAIETVRGWLGIHQEEEDPPWWQFWD
ncbi:hypothetical protein [Marinicauda salina]|nr:hypothetical protein [Marinicauda salina]